MTSVMIVGGLYGFPRQISEGTYLEGLGFGKAAAQTQLTVKVICYVLRS